MPRSSRTPGSNAADRGALQPDWRLLAVVFVCVVALLGLAAIGPPLSGSGNGPSEQNVSDGQPRDTSGPNQQGGSEGTPQGGGGAPGEGQPGSGGGGSGGGGGGAGGSGGEVGGGGGSGGEGGAGGDGRSGALGSSGDLRGSVQLGSLTPRGTMGDGTVAGGVTGSGEATVGELEGAGELAFVVEADSPAYWRLGSYSHLRDGQWVRPPRIGEVTRDDTGNFTQEIRLYADHQTLPAAWRPTSGDTTTAVDVTAHRTSLRGDVAIPAGRGYTVQSARPTTDPDALRDATDVDDGSSPPQTKFGYASRLGDTSVQVEHFTSELTEDDGTRYDRVRTIEQWLRAEKSYDRSAAATGRGPIVDQVVFEMDAVSGEHAATAMVGMARSQGIPARYVAGYSTGYEADGRYFVTEQQSHAWVEVYFPGEGWVPFDPTSPEERRQVEGAFVLAEDSGLHEDLGNYSVTVDASQTEVVATVEDAVEGSVLANGTGGTAPEWVQGTDDAGGAVDVSENAPVGYAIQVNQSEPLPGSTLAIRVLENGEPAEGVGVSLDGEYVGTTGPDGAVTTTVPWVEQLRISIDPSPDGTRAWIGGAAVEAHGRPTGAVESAGRTADTAGSSLAVANQETPDGNESDSGGSGVDVPTYSDVRIRFAGPPTEGAQVQISATLGGRPVPDAAVRVDGESQTRTADDGTAIVTLPDESGNATIRVRRGEIVDNRTVRVRPIDVDAVDGLAAPGTNPTLSLSVGNRSLGGHDVSLDGRSVGETDQLGRVQVQLPDESGDVPITVRDDGFVATTSIDVAPLTVGVEDRLPLPGRPATVAVEHRGEPVDGATVAVDGDRVGTATNGTITTSMPVDADATISAQYDGIEAETEIDTLYRNAAIVGLLAVLGLVGVLAVGVLLYRRYAGPLRDEAADHAGTLRERLRDVLQRVVERARRVPGRLVDLAVRTGRLLHRAGERIASFLHAVAHRIAEAIRTVAERGVGIVLLVPGLLLGLVAWLLRFVDPRRLYARIRAIVARWRSSPEAASTGSTSRSSSYSPNGAADASSDAEQPMIDLRDAWRAFVRAVRPPRVETKTAGEIGRYAVDRGMPASPVDTVVETYRSAEYGGTTPSNGRLRRVVDAVREIAGEDVLAGRLPGDPGGDGDTAGDPGDAASEGSAHDHSAGDPTGSGGD